MRNVMLGWRCDIARGLRAGGGPTEASRLAYLAERIRRLADPVVDPAFADALEHRLIHDGRSVEGLLVGAPC